MVRSLKMYTHVHILSILSVVVLCIITECILSSGMFLLADDKLKLSEIVKYHMVRCL